MGRRLLLLTEEVRNIKKDLHDMQVGDTFFFGDYHGEIEWRVLEKTSDSLLVISEYALDAKPFDKDNKTDDWDSCSLKRWLNSEFFNKAFDSEEKSLIENTSYGKVFLLDDYEAEKYFSNNFDRQCKPTSYALSQGVYTFKNTGYCEWWLCTPGPGELEEPYNDDPDNKENYSNGYYVATVTSLGRVFAPGDEVYLDFNAVRPAMRLVINFM